MTDENADAVFNRGTALYLGLRETQQDKKSGCELFERASRLGHAKATFNLGNCYRVGEHAERDLDRAEELYVVSAAFGVSDAYTSLGVLYLLESE